MGATGLGTTRQSRLVAQHCTMWPSDGCCPSTRCAAMPGWCGGAVVQGRQAGRQHFNCSGCSSAEPARLHLQLRHPEGAAGCPCITVRVLSQYLFWACVPHAQRGRLVVANEGFPHSLQSWWCPAQAVVRLEVFTPLISVLSWTTDESSRAVAYSGAVCCDRCHRLRSQYTGVGPCGSQLCTRRGSVGCQGLQVSVPGDLEHNLQHSLLEHYTTAQIRGGQLGLAQGTCFQQHLAATGVGSERGESLPPHI